jgi:antitoxin (DNA-binding transcriptional repressor) of toxin-antitoxin stability system
MKTITIQQAEGHLAEIIQRLSPGDEVVVTSDNKPVATIRATGTAPHRPRRFGTLKGTVKYIAPDFDAIPEGFEEYLP